MSQLRSDVAALCVHLRILRFTGLAALPLCKQLVLGYLQQFWVDSPWEEVVWVSGQAGLLFGAAGWGGFIPRQVFVPEGMHSGSPPSVRPLALCA